MPASRPVARSALLAVALALTALSAPLAADLQVPPAAQPKPDQSTPVAPEAGAAGPPAGLGEAAGTGADAPPAREGRDDVLVIGYRVEVRSGDPALADAPATVAAVLEDPRGWQQARIDFVAEPDAPFTIVVAEGDEAQALCQPYDVGGRFSCQNGPLVVLNAIRWREAVPHWPLSLADYRTMLVNHEVGHLLGMHHLRCPAAGVPAPVMEQQSGSLRGCQANPWPTPIEVRLAATHQFTLAPPSLDVPFPP